MFKRILTAAIGLFITQYALADGPGTNVPYVAKAQVIVAQGHAAPAQLALHDSTLIMTPTAAGANGQVALHKGVGGADDADE
jgi:hypothetical protein